MILKPADDEVAERHFTLTPASLSAVSFKFNCHLW